MSDEHWKLNIEQFLKCSMFNFHFSFLNKYRAGYDPQAKSSPASRVDPTPPARLLLAPREYPEACFERRPQWTLPCRNLGQSRSFSRGRDGRLLDGRLLTEAESAFRK